MDIRELIQDKLGLIKQLRTKLHQNAELSYQEYKTQEILMDFLKELQLPVSKAATTGVVATLNKDDACIALRADMDALPVKGVSHACGHDYHMAIVCGVAMVLREIGFKKCIKFIFQPGEEAEGGALPMITEGILDVSKVTHMIGFHVWPNVLVGTIEAATGPSMASVDDFKILIKGKGGHAAMPQLCKNPLYPAMDFIHAINEKAKLEINPLDAHVITFSSLQCGNAPNIIADECTLSGTVRTFDNQLRNKIHKDFQNTAALCSEKYHCDIELQYDFQYPPLINDAALANKFMDITKDLIGENNVLPLQPTFAAEDFAYFAEKVPSVHFRLGIAHDEKGRQPLHSTDFDVHEDAIFYGIYIIVNFILAMENH